MKNLFLISALLFSNFIFAQIPIQFGVRAGVSAAGMRGNAVDNLSGLLDFAKDKITTTDRTGFYAGVFAGIPISKNISVEPGLLYTQKGYLLNGELGIKGVEFLGANARMRLQNDYLDIPLLLKVNAGGLQIFGGPQFSYLLSSNLRTTASVLGFNLLNKNIDAINQFNRTDVALTGGIGYNLTEKININAAYDYGLQKIDKNQNVAAYNRGFKLGLSVGF